MNTVRSTPDIRIRLIDIEAPEFEAVIALGKAHSRYLGLFPRGAFEEYVRSRRIIGAVTSAGELAGYLLYRTNRTHAVIVHLCVHERYRRCGVARRLFEKLRTSTTEFHGITLRCRRDFPANAMWPHLGFRAVTERPGRNAEGKPLTLWAFDHDHLTLFSSVGADIEESRVVAALDTNIVFDLQDPPCEKSEESLALEADWVSSAFEFCVTTEVFNDINRADSVSERDRRRSFVRRYREIAGDPSRVDAAVRRIRPLLPDPLSESSESDIRHLAKCVAADVPIFVTRDEGILALREPVFEMFGLSVMSPCELIVAHDERMRSSVYSPSRLAGSLSAIQRISQSDIPGIADTFLSHQHGEKKGRLRRHLRRLLADPQAVEGHIVRDQAGDPLALHVVDRSDTTRLRVPIIRIRRSTHDRALLDHILWKLCILAREAGSTRIDVTDSHLPSESDAALRRLGYVRTHEGWSRLVLDCAASPDILAGRIRELASGNEHLHEVVEPLIRILGDRAIKTTAEVVATVEQALWPAKVHGDALPSFIVPIRSLWASRLFEERLAAESLFGADEGLALSVENVYYRAAKPRVLTAPARVLWYVSKSSEYSGSMSLRAVSYISSVTVGNAKDLYRQYRRLGVYEWSDIQKLAGRTSGEVMAFTFTHTELLLSPVSFARIQEVIRQCTGRGNPLVGPVQVPNECFLQLYSEGTAGQGAAV